jgi:1-phosphatidylinositol-4-phosphate 5-kinase
VGSSSPEAIAMRRAMRSSDPKRLGKHTVRLPEEDTGDRQQFVFYQDEGGLRATDDNNEPLSTIYYLGVIDILTPYNFFKKVEHVWKGMSADRVSVLCFCILVDGAELKISFFIFWWLF